MVCFSFHRAAWHEIVSVAYLYVYVCLVLRRVVSMLVFRSVSCPSVYTFVIERFTIQVICTTVAASLTVSCEQVCVAAPVIATVTSIVTVTV